MAFGSLKPSYGELLLSLPLLNRRNPRCFYPVGRPGLRLLAAARGIQVTVTAPWDGMTVSLPAGPGSPGRPVVLVYVKVQLRLVPPPSAFDRRGPAAGGALVPSDRHANPSGQVVAQSPSGKSAGWTSWPSEPSGRWW